MKILGYEINNIAKLFKMPADSSTASNNVIAVDNLDPFAYHGVNQYNFSGFDGDKFFGGFGQIELQWTDYWALRARSAQLFNENLYARGLIRRLVTNEINTGLTPEAFPDEQVIGVAEDSLQDWSETVENRYNIYSKSPKVCDWKQTSTLGAIQRHARMEALIEGDILVVLRQSSKTNLPMVQLIGGSKIMTPSGGTINLRQGHKIRHGVELNAVGRVVAHWIKQEDGTSKRIPAFGERTGRRISWLVYGTDKRMDDVRGQPMLSLVLQSLKEIDRYRDSVQRKAVINSMVALFVKKTQDKMGSLPISGAAVRKDQANVVDGDGAQRKFNITSQIPGIVMEELQTGEEPVGFGNQGTDDKFGTFEEAIIQAVAWANEVPPEILRLAFSNNYSASQAAINEFKIYLNKVWSEWGETFCTPIYVEWLINETLLQKIKSPGLLEAWRNPALYDIFGAWTCVDWYGSIKPSTDMLKQAKGSKMLVDEGWSTNARESRTTTGTKYSKNIKRVKRENELKVEALRPLAEFNAEFGAPAESDSTASNQTTAVADAIVEALADADVSSDLIDGVLEVIENAAVG